MPLPRIAIPATLAVMLAALPLASAKAQFYGPPCTPFPLTWPICIAGAVVGTAAAVVTAPFRVVAVPPPGPYVYPYYPAPVAPYTYPPSTTYYRQQTYTAPYPPPQ